MTAPRDRLTRLLAIRTVALRAASRELARAVGAMAATTGLAQRIGELQIELTPAVTSSTGQQLKAFAATRNGLQLAAARQLTRVTAAAAHQADAVRTVHRDRAAVEAVERALARRKGVERAGETHAAGDDVPVRKGSR